MPRDYGPRGDLRQGTSADDPATSGSGRPPRRVQTLSGLGQ